MGVQLPSLLSNALRRYRLTSTVTISLAVHLLAWGIVVWTGALNPAIILAKKPEAKRQLALDFIKPRPKPETTIIDKPKPPPPSPPKPPKKKNLPNIFVQVDPKQASAKKPEDTDKYSDKNSLAANPKPGNKPKPEIDGSQREIPRTHDVLQPAKAKLDLARPPASDATSESLEHSSLNPEPTSPILTLPNIRPQNTHTQIPKSDPKFAAKLSAPINLTKSAPILPPASPIDIPSVLLEPKSSQPKYRSPLERAKHRLAIAKRPKPQLLTGKAIKQDGTAPREGTPKFNVALTGFGSYDKIMITAIRNSWLRKNRETRMHQPYRVVVEFELLNSGRVENMHIKDAYAPQSQTLPELICVASIDEPAPFARWDKKMKHELGTRRRCTITFSFNLPD